MNRAMNQYCPNRCSCQQTCAETYCSMYSNNSCGCSYDDAPEKSIAMAYVPWQIFNTTYDYKKGFYAGTIFPELDLPFEKARCR